jgi:release factor glutamine methyltransferase
MRLHLDTEVNPEHLEKIQQGYNAYTVDKKPLEYILGHIDFFGVPFFVNEHTIIPRPETEYMITAVSEWTREQGKKSDF